MLGLLIKYLPFVFLLHNRPPSDIPGIWGGTTEVDTHSYLDPIENLLRNGSYSPDYRMPGYGFVYFIARLIFSQIGACNVLVLLQFIHAGISVYYLALAAKLIFKNDRIFYITFYLFLFSTYSNYYDGWLLAESLCSSTLIFGVYFFAKYFTSGDYKSLLFSGLFITWAIFLRPVFAPLILVFLTLIVVCSTNKKKYLIGLVWFLIPFAVAETAWVGRNYVVHKKIVILSQSIISPQADLPFKRRPLFEFIRSWGGSTDFTDNHSALLWFGYHMKDTSKHQDSQGSLPDNIYTSQFNNDSLLNTKHLVMALCDSALPPNKFNLYETELNEKMNRYTASIKHEKPLLYYVEAPLFHCLPRFLFGEESRIYTTRFQLPGAFGVIIKFIFRVFYCLIIAFGFIGIVLLLFRFKKNILAIIFALIPLYTIMIHAIILRYTYNRFLMPAWAFLIVCAAYVIVRIAKRKPIEENL